MTCAACGFDNPAKVKFCGSWGRIAGTMPHGGGPFENVRVRVIVTDGHRIQRYELFDIRDTDRALARFEELCTELPQPRPSVAALRIRELG